MRKRERKYIAPNEASFKRWIAVLTAGELIGLLLCVFLIPFEPDPESVIMGIFYDEIYNKLFWIPLLGGFVFALKHLGKTSGNHIIFVFTIEGLIIRA